MLAKIFAIFWFLVACHDVLETFVFPKILGDENTKIDLQYAKESAQDFMNLKSLASVRTMKRIMVLIAILSALIHALGFYLTYIFGNFSGDYEKIFYGIVIFVALDFLVALFRASNFLRDFKQDTSVDEVAENFLKANSRNAVLHFIACIGIFLTSLRLILELFFN